MNPEPPDFAPHEPALHVWARCQLPGRVRGKLDPSDLVQQTLMEAVAAAHKLTGRPEHEVLAYLRRALSNNAIDAARKFERTKDDISPDAAAASSVRLADWLAANHTSPSERASRNERFERLADALTRLPDAQRMAVEMRYLQSMKVADIAGEMNRSEGAVSLLLHRAVAELRGVLDELPASKRETHT